MFLLTDDFDLYDVDQEVIYDSLIDHGQDSIKDEILRISGEPLLASCYKD